MDQDTAFRDNVSNKQTRGNHRGAYRGNYRALGTSTRPNQEGRYNDATNQSNDHFVNTHNLQEQNNVTPSLGFQRGTISFRGRVGRVINGGQVRGRGYAHGSGQIYGRGQFNSGGQIYGRGQARGRGQFNGTGRGRGHVDTDMYSRSTHSASSQAQDHHATSSALWFQEYAHSPTGELITRHSPVLQPDMNPDLAQLAIEYCERMNMNLDSNSWSQQQGSRIDDLQYRQLPAPRLHGISTLNTQSFYESEKPEPAGQALSAFIPQMSLDTVNNGTRSSKISALTGMSFQAGQSFQSSPLSYISAFSTMQVFATNSSVAMDSTLGNPFELMYVSVLIGLLVPTEKLEEHGYKVRDLTKRELEDKQRCFGCGKFWSKVRQNLEYQRMMAKKTKVPKKQPISHNEKHGNSSEPKNDDVSSGTLVSNSKKAELEKPKPILNCRFHPGTLTKAYEQAPRSQGSRNLRFRKFWTCCNKDSSAEPCSGSEHHELRDSGTNALLAQWQTYATPQVMPGHVKVSYRIAVALDCEMGVSKASDSELIRVTVIDYFTSETLIDKLVFPTVPMLHLNTAYSGVTWTMLNAAAAKGECFHGRAAALEEVWKFVGPETIVVAHSGYNDLNSLRWRHYKIVDTFLIDSIPAREKEREKERERLRELSIPENQQKAIHENKSDHAGREPTKITPPSNQEQSNKTASIKAENTSHAKTQDKQGTLRKVKGRGPFSLKTLAKSRLERDIQTGTKGHDSLEDALATRDLAHWHVRRIIEGRGTVNAEGNVQGNVATGI